MKNILMLIDYRKYFYSSATREPATMDAGKIKSLLSEKGFNVDVKNFCEVDFRSGNYSDTYVLYTSQEDPDLKYKDFIEDILLGLKEKGAVLIPEFKYFRAHHNKVFMEILRDVSELKEIKNIESKYFGTLEEYIEFGRNLKLPAVMKPAAGAVSKGVTLVDSKNIACKTREITRSFVFKDFVKLILKKTIDFHAVPNSLNRNKFIIQTLAEGLKGDRKVLIYGNRYYVLDRENRENDFRASGSGLFSWPEEVSSGLLNFAEKIFASFHIPCVSLDIGENNGDFFLIEFQVMMFGTYTLEKSGFYFEKRGNLWEKVVSKSDLETVFCESLTSYIERIEK